jgi:flagellar hook assembly protein FlgD
MDAPRTTRRARRCARARGRLIAAAALAVVACVLPSTAGAVAKPGVARSTIDSVSASPAAFVPDWDGHTDETVVSYRLLGRSRVVLRVLDARGRIVASFAAGVQGAGAHEASWDGRGRDGRVLAPGRYRLRIDAAPSSAGAPTGAPAAADLGGAPIVSGSRAAVVTLQRPAVTLTRVQLSRTAVGRAKRSASTSARFTLSRAATISAAVLDSQGQVVDTLATGARRAGTSSVTWDGRTRDGGLAADGEYSLVVAATGGGRPTATSRVPLRVDRVVPTLTIPKAVTATVAGSVVSVPLGVRASEAGTVTVRFGKRHVQQGVAAGAATVTVAGSRLGVVATAARRSLTVTVVLTDGAGNAVSRRVGVTVPPRTRVVDRAPAGGGDPTSTPGTGSWPWPSIGIVTSEFGVRWGRKHEGIDIGTDTGTPIHPAIAGTVSFVGAYGGYGNLVIVDHGGGVTTRYGHMSRFGSFAVGAHVTHDDVIGYVGCTGSCTGPHVHFEVRVDDVARSPRTYLVPR